MAIRHVERGVAQRGLTVQQNLIFQQGLSLIELLLALTIGSGVVLFAASEFARLQQLELRHSAKLQTQAALYQTLFMLRAELRRAGFNPDTGASARLVGASGVIASGSDWLDFVSVADANQWYKTRYQYDGADKSLDLCVQRVDVTLPPPSVGACTGFAFSLLDRAKRYSPGFEVIQRPINGGQTSLIDFRMSIATNDGEVVVTQAVTIKQRNWQ